MIFWFWSFSKMVDSSTGIDVTGRTWLRSIGDYIELNNFEDKVVDVDGVMMEMQECYIYVGF